jgi:hypothetical protein
MKVKESIQKSRKGYRPEYFSYGWEDLAAWLLFQIYKILK